MLSKCHSFTAIRFTYHLITIFVIFCFWFLYRRQYIVLSLNSLIPRPNPHIISGNFLPPNNNKAIAQIRSNSVVPIIKKIIHHLLPLNKLKESHMFQNLSPNSRCHSPPIHILQPYYSTTSGI